MFYDVKITRYSHAGTHKIADIKGLREKTRLPFENGAGGVTMGLTAAKTAIEAMYLHGSVVIRLTPEQFAAWSFNDYKGTFTTTDWFVDSITVYFPQKELETVFTF